MSKSREGVSWTVTFFMVLGFFLILSGARILLITGNLPNGIGIVLVGFISLSFAQYSHNQRIKELYPEEEGEGVTK